MAARVKVGWIEAPEAAPEAVAATWTPERATGNPAWEADEALSERMCIVTREVMDEDGSDPFRPQPRWPCGSRSARLLAGARRVGVAEPGKVCRSQRKSLFARGFHAETQVRSVCPKWWGGFCGRRRFPIFSLPRKAGEAVAGFMKVEPNAGRRPGPRADPCERGRARWLPEAGPAAAARGRDD